MESNTPRQQPIIKPHSPFSQITPATPDPQSASLSASASKPATATEPITAAQPPATTKPSKFFKGCTFTIICLFLCAIGIVGAIISTYFASAFLSALIISVAAIASVIVPFVSWLADKAGLDTEGWFNKMDYFIEKYWNKLTKSGPLRISQTIIRFCFIIILLCAITVSSIIYPAIPQFIHKILFPTTPTQAPLTPSLLFSQKLNGQLIGISDGRSAFDVDARNGTNDQQHRDGQLKLAAADAYAKGDYDLAKQYWDQAILSGPNTGTAPDTDDAEIHIYEENRRIITSKKPYMTLIVAVPLTGSPNAYNIGRDILQGMYVKQSEFNHPDKDNDPGFRLRLLIANIGDQGIGAAIIADHIQQYLAFLQKYPWDHTKDRTIVGVIGWPIQTQTSRSDQALRTICDAPIPIVTLSADDQSDCSFSVTPKVSAEAQAATDYATKLLHARRVAIIYDAANTYSDALATSFSADFRALDPETYRVIATLPYTLGSGDPLPDLVKAALKGEPDLIYFIGYPNDLQNVFPVLTTSGSPMNIMGTAMFYQAVHNSQILQKGQGHLYYTAFAYPDEWEIFSQSKPPFVQDYIDAFDPSHIYPPGTYGYERANSDIIVAYDALGTVCVASEAVLSQGKASASLDAGEQIFSPQNLRTELAKTRYSGLSGQISFDQDGNAVDKVVLVIGVDQQGRNYLATSKGLSY